MRKVLVFSALLTCLALGPLTTSAATAASTSTTTTRPFTLFLQGTATPGTNDVTGTFHATQLRSGHFSETSTVLLINGSLIVFGTHTVLTATDGETLIFDGAVVEVPSTTPHCHGGALSGGAIITGGTGRFADATGQVQTTGCLHYDVSPVALTAFSQGSITF